MSDDLKKAIQDAGLDFDQLISSVLDPACTAGNCAASCTVQCSAGCDASNQPGSGGGGC
jgi:hypothetical protein